MFLKTNRWHKDKSVPSIFQPEQLLRQHKFLDEAWAIRVWWGWFWLKTNPRRMLWAQGLSRKFRKYSSNYKSLELVLELSFQFLKAFVNEVNSPQKSISQSLHLTVRSFGPRDHHIFGGIWQYCVWNRRNKEVLLQGWRRQPFPLAQQHLPVVSCVGAHRSDFWPQAGDQRRVLDIAHGTCVFLFQPA